MVAFSVSGLQGEVWRTIGMPNVRCESEFWRAVGIVLRKRQDPFEEAAFATYELLLSLHGGKAA